MGEMQDGGKRISYETGAIREPSSGKGAYELISPFAIERIAKWYELGAQKYADRNWEKGIPFGRLIQSANRHLIRWEQGDHSEDHLAAICWNIMAMMHFEEIGKADELNNYPKYKNSDSHSESIYQRAIDAMEWAPIDEEARYMRDRIFRNETADKIPLGTISAERLNGGCNICDEHLTADMVNLDEALKRIREVVSSTEEPSSYDEIE